MPCLRPAYELSSSGKQNSRLGTRAEYVVCAFLKCPLDADLYSAFDYDCPGKRNCTLDCQCPSRVSALESLATVYNEQCKSDSEVEVVVRGHVAVLFGLLMRHSAENQRILLASLPGASNKKKLHALAANAREFMLFYVEFTKKISAVAGEDEGEAEGGESSSQGGGMGTLMRDSQGENVARSVTMFLEDLRNSTRD